MNCDDPINLDYSTKNIPIPTQKDYIRCLINKTEKFIRNVRWRTFFFLNPDAKAETIETYGFNSTKPSPSIPELKNFENGLLNIIKSVKFKQITNNLQEQLKTDIKEIRKSKEMIIPADKTNNFYKVTPEKYEELMNKCLNKDYHKSEETLQIKLTKEDKRIAEKLKLSDRIEVTAQKEAFLKLKDHKENFRNNQQCRLINPCKTEIGKISKQILERININIKMKTKLTQWKNTTEVIQWFNNIPDKSKHQVITFDICEFYPSISKKLFNDAIKFAKDFTNISKRDIEIMNHTKSSLLYHNETPWEKNGNNFDVTMGSYDGAETCELVGLFLLNQLKEISPNIGLYRDDGIAIIKGTRKETENMKKKICEIFKNNNLKITINANHNKIDFLDVTFDFKEGTYRPFKKPNDVLNYVHKLSNHPPSITKNIPKNINLRLSNLSSNEQLFNQSTKHYQEALNKSGYVHQFKYTKTKELRKEDKDSTKKRQRNITWFNPPYSQNVTTNIGQQFLKLLDKSFPKNNKLNKILNRNTIKISYSCMPNIQHIITSHNKKLQKNHNKVPSNETNTANCNCRKKDECPLNNNCLEKSIIYQATVTNDNNQQKETYIGLTENSFKTRFTEHKSSFKNQNKRNATTLSEHIWKLKDKNIKHHVKWKILDKAVPYTPSAKNCKLCLTEKFYIIINPQESTLNRRNELTTTCRHRWKYFLSHQ